MKRALAALCALCAFAGPGAAAARGSLQPARPLLFEPVPSVGFVMRGPEYTALLHSSVLTAAPAAGGPMVELRLPGADPAAKMTGQGALPGRSHYYLGDDPARWRIGVPHFARVSVEAIHPGIDLVYYGSRRELEFDFVVAPGADPGCIQIEVAGDHELAVDEGGDLVVQTPGGELRLRRPRVYQEVDGARRPVDGRYVLLPGSRRRAGFRLAAYDTARPLVIDPALGFASRVGGSDLENGFDVALDADGNVYLAGGTSSADFPAPAGEAPVLLGTGGSAEAFVIKLAPDGSTVLYSTFLGGTAFDQARGIAVDDDGNAYIAGTTSFQDTGFPSTPGAYRTSAADFFVSVLDPDGALTYSTFFGGLNIASLAGLALHGSGADARVYLAGSTVRGFPTTANAWATSLGGAAGGAFLSVLEPGQPVPADQLVYSTVFVGGGGIDVATGPDGKGYLLGDAGAPGLTLRGAFDTTFAPNREAFLAVFDPEQSGDASLLYSTYIGGSGTENGAAGDGGVAVDANGVALVTGSTDASDFPVTPEGQRVSRQGLDAFLVAIDPSLPGPDSLRHGTFLGGSAADQGTDVAAGPPGIAYVTGYGSSSDLPDGDGGIAPKFGAGPRGAVQDAWLVKVDWTRVGDASLIDAAYVGGSNGDFARAIASDGDGQVVIAGDTTSADGWLPSPGPGSNDAFAAALSTILQLPDGTLGSDSSDLLTADFGTPPYGWSVVSGAPNPGLALAADGTLSGVPSELGSATFTARITDSLGAMRERTYRKRIGTGGTPSQILIRKSGPVPVPGRVFPYRILLRNTTQVTLTNIEVTEILDHPLRFVSATPPPVYVDPWPGNVVWVLPQLAPDEFRVITYEVQLLPNDFPDGIRIEGTACLTDEDCNDMRAECEEEGLEFCENTLCQGPGSFARCEACKQDEKNRCREKWNICKQKVGQGSSEVLTEGTTGGGCATDVEFSNSAHDPNEKRVTSPPFVPPGEVLGYSIHFENVGTIEARDVFLTDVLDPDLDLSTVQVLRPLGGLMPLPPDTTVSILDDGDEQWSVSLDTGSRTISWELVDIDLLPDATDSVFFTVRAPEDLPTGTEIRNEATIQFEVFEVITTNETLNTVDATPPTCAVDGLPAVTVGDQVDLTWTAADPLGEVERTVVYVSEDGGPFLQLGETEESAATTFVGSVGSTYGFLCLARDTAGNVEAQDLAVAETTTTLTAAEEVTGRLAITSSGESSSLDRLTRELTSTADLQLENTSDAAILAPWRASFVISDPSVEMPDADGTDVEGRPFYDLTEATGLGRLAPGVSTSFPVSFRHPPGVSFTYAVAVTGVVEAAPAPACGLGGLDLLLVGALLTARRRRWSRRPAGIDVT